MKFKFSHLMVLSGFILLSHIISAQSNTLLERSFWKTKPSAEQVRSEISEGNDPAELNSNSFDPLVYAILEQAPEETLKLLLAQQGNSVDKITHDGRTYIFWAAYKDNLSFVKYLVGQGARTDLVDEHGNSVLIFAALAGTQNQDLYDFLIQHGSSPGSETDRRGANAILLILPHLDSFKMIDYFESRGLSLSDTDSNGNGAFNYTARGGNIEMMNRLIDRGVAFNVTNKNGGTAMHFAARGMRGHSNSLEVFRYLKQKGLDPNLAENNGDTPLSIYASNGKDPEVITFLLSNGADPDQANNEGSTALMNAAKSNQFEILSPLVSTSKAINATNEKGQTALMVAVEKNAPKSVKLLLDAEADVRSVDKNGNSALYYLIESFRLGSTNDFNAKYGLLEKSNLDFTSVQGGGNTFFHLAAFKNELYLLEKAAELNLDINAKNRNGLTPLHIAAMKANNDKTLRFLVDNGADKAIRTDFDESAYQLASENELLERNKIDLKFLQN